MGSQLKRLTTYNNVKNLFEKGLITQISRSIGLGCKTMEGDSKDDEKKYGKCLIKPPLRLGNLLKAAWPITHRYDWCLECIPKQLVKEASVFLFMLICKL
ncbi:hypothetical protein HGB07_09875, partial [Candidatus Roizmanbacteria bacterium]|nr:hypothetical protein [Candidatus Roizmanbacteria bacterium]